MALEIHRDGGGFLALSQEKMLLQILLKASHLKHACSPQDNAMQQTESQLLGSDWRTALQVEAMTIFEAAQHHDTNRETSYALFLAPEHQCLVADALLAYALRQDNPSPQTDWTKFNERLYPEDIVRQIEELKRLWEEEKNNKSEIPRPAQARITLPPNTSESAINTLLLQCQKEGHPGKFQRNGPRGACVEVNLRDVEVAV